MEFRMVMHPELFKPKQHTSFPKSQQSLSLMKPHLKMERRRNKMPGVERRMKSVPKKRGLSLIKRRDLHFLKTLSLKIVEGECLSSTAITVGETPVPIPNTEVKPCRVAGCTVPHGMGSQQAVDTFIFSGPLPTSYL